MPRATTPLGSSPIDWLPTRKMMVSPQIGREMGPARQPTEAESASEEGRRLGVGPLRTTAGERMTDQHAVRGVVCSW